MIFLGLQLTQQNQSETLNRQFSQAYDSSMATSKLQIFYENNFFWITYVGQGGVQVKFVRKWMIFTVVSCPSKKRTGDKNVWWLYMLLVIRIECHFFFRKMVGEYRFAVEQQGLQVPISCCALVVFSWHFFLAFASFMRITRSYLTSISPYWSQIQGLFCNSWTTSKDMGLKCKHVFCNILEVLSCRLVSHCFFLEGFHDSRYKGYRFKVSTYFSRNFE